MSARTRDRGQAAIELALALPLLVIVTLGAVQVVIVVVHQLVAIHAAREGARAAAVSADPTAAGSTAAHGASSDESLSVDVAVTGDSVTVTVALTDPTDVALVGALLPDITLHGHVTMALEPP